MSLHTSTAPTSLSLQSRVPSLRGRRVNAILMLLALGPFPFLDVMNCQGTATETYTGLALFTQSWELSVGWPVAISALLALATFGAHKFKPWTRVGLSLLDVVATLGLHACVAFALLSAAFFHDAAPTIPGLLAYTILWLLSADVVITLVVRLVVAVRTTLRSRLAPRDLERPPGTSRPRSQN